MQTARIVRFHRLGGPEVLQIDTLPVPEPGPGEVLLRVQAFGLSRGEVMFRQGNYLLQPQLPSNIGYEAAGEVEAVGEGVDAAWLGRRVSTMPSFAANRYGVYGEMAVVPVTALAEYPAEMTPELGAAVWSTYVTAYGALVEIGRIAKGDHVVITAASSSVGLAAVELVRAEGAVSIAVTRTRAKRSQLLELGADHVIVAEDEDLAARVFEITRGRGARLIFDAVAGSGVERLAEAAADGGILIEYGALAMEPTPFPLFAAFRKGLTMRAYTLFETLLDQRRRIPALRYVFDRLARGEFKPRIDRIFTLDQIVEAHRYMESNQQMGKIVVRTR